MRHRVAGRKLGRTTAHRTAMFRNLVTSLFEHERILTTIAKAKEARPVAEKLITLAKREGLHSRRRALRFVRKREVMAKLFDTIAPRFADRNGGYTRILRAEQRKGDGSQMAVLEILGSDWREKLEEKKRKREEKEKKRKAAS
jgi:large subunit ribosomal protein L17